MRGEAVSDSAFQAKVWASASAGALCFVQPMSELRVAFLEGFGELCSPTCPRQAAEPPFWEAPGWCEVWGFFYMRNPAAGTRPPREDDMDTTTLLIIIVVLLVLGGGWYGRGRWY
jgi:hypothetical protein